MFNVLVIDDKKEYLIFAEEQLSLLGCQVSLAQEPAIALKHFQGPRFDFVLSDLYMPLGAGKEGETIFLEDVSGKNEEERERQFRGEDFMEGNNFRTFPHGLTMELEAIAHFVPYFGILSKPYDHGRSSFFLHKWPLFFGKHSPCINPSERHLGSTFAIRSCEDFFFDYVRRDGAEMLDNTELAVRRKAAGYDPAIANELINSRKYDEFDEYEKKDPLNGKGDVEQSFVIVKNWGKMLCRLTTRDGRTAFSHHSRKLAEAAHSAPDHPFLSTMRKAFFPHHFPLHNHLPSS